MCRFDHVDQESIAMKFPYGLKDFGTLRREGYFYQDRTDRIPQLEEAGPQLVFIRPRRFGKTLLLSMLEHYYDINRADDFEALFSGLAIARHPTPRHHQYLVLHEDYCLVKARAVWRTSKRLYISTSTTAWPIFSPPMASA
jgi:hypothetical protein